MPMNPFARRLAACAGLSLVLGCAAYAPDATARTQVSVQIGTAPPPLRYERMPPPRHGYVWTRGYWRWDPYARRHIWVHGHWLHARPGYHYRPPHWVRHGDRWRFRDGYWGR
jgi:hypothetical protein